MCEYCGCRDIPLIGRLSEEHYQAVDSLGVLRRAIDTRDPDQVSAAVTALAGELIPHNESEEAGLFHELAKDEYFAPTVAELIEQHGQFKTLLARIEGGDWDAYAELEVVLRHHIDREENGLFPATAVAVDGDVWEEIDRLTHEFNHARHREHGHTEAEQLELAREAHAGSPDAPGPFAIRTATRADAPALVAHWRRCGVPAEAAAQRAATAKPHPKLALIAVAGDDVVGDLLGTWDHTSAWFSAAEVDPGWDARHVEPALLAAAEAAARGLGARRMLLLGGRLPPGFVRWEAPVFARSF